MFKSVVCILILWFTIYILLKQIQTKSILYKCLTDSSYFS